MKEKIRRYQYEDITIYYNSERCNHARKCVKGLKNVSNPKQKPWIQLEGALWIA